MAIYEMKALLLGTANWAWTVTKAEAFRQMDAWLQAGLSGIDTATNYPINKNPQDFRAAEMLLEEYLKAHGLHKGDITVKIGAMDNLRSPAVNLSPSYIRMMGEEYARRFGDNLGCVMFHWDNRSDPDDIDASLSALQSLCADLNIRAGISGVKHPEVYALLANERNLTFDIQLKNNVLQSDFPRYAPLLDMGTHRFFAYGINAGGLKLDGQYSAGNSLVARGADLDPMEKAAQTLRDKLPHWNTAFVRPPLRAMQHIGLVHSGLDARLAGMVLGFSKTSQLLETLDYLRNIDMFDYQDVYRDLTRLTF